MKNYFLLLLLLALCACQNVENEKKNIFFKNGKENSINMNTTISEIEIKN
tara:strand:- start:38 stop:187 length:150 start_codon:yes stop_codon:yes gene_type:complete